MMGSVQPGPDRSDDEALVVNNWFERYREAQ
ncbi:hypothetical protein Mycsm_01713 [Mycobacterium sp. JS623]|nr:hypothetical protein Mycsm_01713 [Mycobacterium sp. JS623]